MSNLNKKVGHPARPWDKDRIWGAMLGVPCSAAPGRIKVCVTRHRNGNNTDTSNSNWIPWFGFAQFAVRDSWQTISDLS